MSQPNFDTLKYAKLLISSGFNPTQVQGLMSAQIEVLQSTLNKLVTHDDLYVLEVKMDQVEQKLDSKIDQVAQRLDSKIDQVTQRLDSKIDQVAQRLDSKIDLVEQKLVAKISEVKAFTLKNTIFTILAVLSLNASFFALFK
ncbi:MAG: hypothetical protein WC748_03980 [Legionellales bacterium]|jgi:hypothetical protein